MAKYRLKVTTHMVYEIDRLIESDLLPTKNPWRCKPPLRTCCGATRMLGLRSRATRL